MKSHGTICDSCIISLLSKASLRLQLKPFKSKVLFFSAFFFFFFTFFSLQFTALGLLLVLGVSVYVFIEMGGGEGCTPHCIVVALANANLTFCGGKFRPVAASPVAPIG